MKRLVWLLLFIPVFLSAQEDNRYLEGAVPVENGKVIFGKTLTVANYSKDQVYDLMLAWAEQRFNSDDKRMVYANREKGEIACISQEYLVFSRTALSLDRTRISYRLTIECENEACHIKLGGIRYEYEVSYQQEPEKYLAEMWITDKYALNKAKTKLNRISGKFRRETVNLADSTFQSVASTVAEQMTAANRTATAPAQNVPSTQPVSSTAAASPVSTPTGQAATGQTAVSIPAATLTPAIPAATQPAASLSTAATSSMEGYVLFEADKIPLTLLDMLPGQILTLTTVNTPAATETAATWKGIGNLFGRKIASVALPAGSPFDRSTGINDTFRLAFSKSQGETPWMIIECSKQGETPEGGQKTVIGEILHVWIR